MIALLNALYAWGQFFDFDPIYHPYKNNTDNLTFTRKIVVGFMHNPNHLSALIGICLPCFFRRKWWVLIPVVLSALFLKNWTVCHTRGGMLLAAFTLAYFLFFYLDSFKEIDTFWLLLFFVILGMNIVYVLYRWKGAQGRLVWWEKIVKNMSQAAWFKGYGLGNFKVLRPVGNRVLEAHNEYFQILYESGMFSLLAVIGYIADSIYKFIKMKKTQETLIIFCVLCCVAINCLTNFTFHMPHLMIIALLAIAMWEVVKKEVANG